MEVSLTELLAARESRAASQRRLLREYERPVICFTMNIAGPVKDTPRIRRGFALGLQKLLGLLEVERFPMLHRQSVRAHTGWEELLVVDGPAASLKALTTQLEDATPLGRLFDLDVLDTAGEKLSRPRPRRCLICGGPAQVCARSRAHSVPELQAKTNALLDEAILEDDSHLAARLAQQALLYEVAVTPKPGLVDRLGSGSHRDMDFFTFQRSAATLYPYFVQCVRIGRATREQEPVRTLEALRFPGKEAEARMREATGGVNTHKGSIFSFGLLCGALGRLEREQWQPEQVLMVCAAMSRELLGELEAGGETAGQRLYREYGLTGVRGQAAAGYPAVLHIGLPKLAQGISLGLSLNDAACATLLALIVGTEDTNLIHRGGQQRGQQVMRELSTLLEREPFPGRETLERLDKSFVRDNLSPGGSADLLAMTLMLWFLQSREE